MAGSATSMQDKICMVTGATSGIGRVTARVLAEQGAHVIVVGRSQRKSARTVREIQARARNGYVEYRLADFASLASIEALAAEFKATHRQLHVLVNNAGAFFLRRQQSEDGIERTLAVNHLGYFLLTRLLLDALTESAPSRIVNVSSDAHHGRALDFDDLEMQRDYRGMEAYGRSKLANIYFTYELARRLEGTGVTANALHPGFVATNLGANNLPWIGQLVKRVINLAAADVETGAQTVVYLATSPEVEGVTGKYFVDCKQARSSLQSYDGAAGRRLWQWSEKAVGRQ